MIKIRATLGMMCLTEASETTSWKDIAETTPIRPRYGHDTIDDQGDSADIDTLQLVDGITGRYHLAGNA